MSQSNYGTEQTESRLTDVQGHSGVYHAYHDPESSAELSQSVIAAVADVADVDPTTTVIPLAERVDPDALDALFTGETGDARVTIELCGLDVVVYSDGHIEVSDQPGSSPCR